MRERGGYLILCHPFRYRPELTVDVDRFPPDAIEVHSRNTPDKEEKRIRAIAGRTGAMLLSSSDAHRASSVGAFFNRFREDTPSMPALLAALRSGAFEPIVRPTPAVPQR